MQEAAGSNPVAPILYSNRKWLNPGWFSLLILLTNDDGIDSRGFTLLKERLSKRHDVLAIAPEKERTCVGHAITLHKPLRIKKIDEALFSTNGTPADCVLLGTKVLMKKMPDLVISGINRGPNMEEYNEYGWVDQFLEDNYEERVNGFYDDSEFLDYEDLMEDETECLEA